jgi:DtxR family transcriptional regulator, Mn-dependent transcriptional regulator
MQSPSEENYLKTIYLLGKQENSRVNITLLASALGNNPASVVEMIKKLTDKNLVAYNKVEGVSLTEAGKTEALLLVRKHRLWELFLMEKLGYMWDEVHEIAEQMEHIQDINLADRLDSFLGFPQFDPHGEPIPTSTGSLPEEFKKSLAEVDTGLVCQVISVKDTSKDFLQYAQKLNIGIGTTIQVVSRISFDESLVIKIGNHSETTVSRKFADNIFVG